MLWDEDDETPESADVGKDEIEYPDDSDDAQGDDAEEDLKLKGYHNE